MTQIIIGMLLIDNCNLNESQKHAIILNFMVRERNTVKDYFNLLISFHCDKFIFKKLTAH